MLKGFRDFLMRGNVVELATAVIIGTAFSGVVDGLIKGIIDPLIAVFAPGEVKQLENALMLGPFKIGLVVSAIINFILKAAVVYVFIVKPFAKLSSMNFFAFPGWPLPCVSLYMPLTNASMIVLRPITSVKASPVMIVVRHRTCRFRRL